MLRDVMLASMSSLEYADWRAYYALQKDYDTAVTVSKIDPDIATLMVWGPPKDEDGDVQVT